MYSLNLHKQVKTFFLPFFDTIKLSYNSHKIDLLFLSNLFISLDSLQLNNIKISYYSNIINSDLWTNSYHIIPNDMIAICNYFSYDNTFNIFKLIKDALETELYIVDSDKINCNIINDFYIFSINKLLDKVYIDSNNDIIKLNQVFDKYDLVKPTFENKLYLDDLINNSIYNEIINICINNPKKVIELNIVEVIKSKKKKQSIPLTLKRKVWNKWIGEDIGKSKCICCKLTDITQMSFSCGHIIAESKGGLLILDNLKPICVSCNSSMGTQNMDEFIIKYGF